MKIPNEMNPSLKLTLKTSAIIFGSVMAITSFDSITMPTIVEAEETPVAIGQTSNVFLNKVIPHAFELAHENDLYASVMIAQAILESGWGNSALSSEPNNNLFGIKGDYDGQTVVMDTLEDSGNQNYYQIQDGFRKYPSYRESLIDYVGVIKNGPAFDPTYYSGAWKSNTTSYQDATAWLTGRYATDTAYGSKLNNLIVSNDLAQYDTPIGATGDVKGVLVPSDQVAAYNSGNQDVIEQWEAQEDTDVTVNPVVTGVGPTKPTNNSTSSSYTIKAGDGIYSAARALGISVAEVKKVNSLTSDLIHPGQVLYGKSQVSSKPATPAESTETSDSTSTKASYTVKAGDGIYSAARALGISVAEVKAANGLTSNLIHPGQVLYGTSSASVELADSTETPANNSTSSSYTVKAGDGIYSAARALGISVAEVKAANGLTSNLIHPGQVLYGTSSASVEPADSTETPADNSTSSSYTVKAGDGMYSAAQALGISVAEVKAVNGLTSNLIQPGQVLYGTSSTATKSASSIETATPANNSTSSSYTVKAGDGIYSAARALGISVAEVKSANGLTSNLIQPGQVLNGTSQVKITPVATTAPAATETTSQASSADTHTVKSGETMWRIANKNGMTVEQIKGINGLSTSTVYIGQVLKLSGSVQPAPKVAATDKSTNQKATPAQTEEVSSQTAATTYTVKKGENLYRIAKNNKVSLEDLKSANNLTSNDISVGQVLTIPS